MRSTILGDGGNRINKPIDSDIVFHKHRFESKRSSGFRRHVKVKITLLYMNLRQSFSIHWRRVERHVVYVIVWRVIKQDNHKFCISSFYNSLSGSLEGGIIYFAFFKGDVGNSRN